MLHYYDCLLEPRRGVRLAEMATARSHTDLVHAWVEAMLMDEPPSPTDLFLRASSGELTDKPAHGSATLTLWKRQGAIMRVLDPAEAFSYNADKLSHLFRLHGFWTGLVSLLDGRLVRQQMSHADRRE